MNYEKILEFLDGMGQGVPQGTSPNQYSTKPICYEFKEADVEKFNKIYKTLYNSELNTLIRTTSGGIAYNTKAMFNNSYAWDIIVRATGCRITVCIGGYTFVYKIGHVSKDCGKDIAPYKAWTKFVYELREDGVDINDYKITPEEGVKVKEEIPMPMIKMYDIKKKDDDGLTNVHHIDFHNSYPGGLAITHPEFRATIERLYKKRKQDEIYKAIMNYSIGSMQSLKNPWKAQWAHLAKDAICNNIERMKQLSSELILTGHRIIGFNTDGIWYQGTIYHGDGEGNNVGEWSNDHTNCKFRAKSDGAYEYIENGKYYPVVRGCTKLDEVKDREFWQWGDIYGNNAEAITYEFKEGDGIIYGKED